MASDGNWYPPATSLPRQRPPAPQPAPLPGPVETSTAANPLSPGVAATQLGEAPKTKRPVSKAGRAVQIVSIVVILIVVAIFGASAFKTSVDLGGTIDEFLVDNPATVIVRVKVTNTRQKPVDNVGCTVIMGEGAYTGSNYVEWEDASKTLAPGQSDFFKVSVTIESEGAAYVKGGTATCQGKEK